MIVTIQAVPERVKLAIKLAEQFIVHKPTITVDKQKRGNFPTFEKMLEIPVTDFRLHLQDDAILCKNFEAYMPSVHKHMDRFNVDIVSFFLFDEGYEMIKNNKRYGDYLDYKSFYGAMGIMFSAKIIPALQANIKKYRLLNFKHKHAWRYGLNDDSFLTWVIRKESINTHVHIPVLVQHNGNLKSTLRHARGKAKMSSHFKANFIWE